MLRAYVLTDNDNPVFEPDLAAWAVWFEAHLGRRIVAQTPVGDALVSTVFLGIDHGFGNRTPVLWESMIFGGPDEGYQERYTTKADALAGHERLIKMLMRASAGD